MKPTNARGQELPPKIVTPARQSGFIAQLGITLTGDRDANARLIAAAPDLLEACQQAAVHRLRCMNLRLLLLIHGYAWAMLVLGIIIGAVGLLTLLAYGSITVPWLKLTP